MFERLPTPWGLVRVGVAPDHPGTKRCRRCSAAPGARLDFHLNVEVGTHVTHDELLDDHHAVIYAVGASTDRRLGIPGEDLPGSHSATEFVAWYNGHPDYAERTFDLSGERAVIVGNGNVALDVARILVNDLDELATPTSPTTPSPRCGEQDPRGRRARPPRACPGRLHERRAARARPAGRRRDRVRPDEVELDDVSRAWLDEEGTFTAHKNVELLREFAQRPPQPGAERRIELRFLRSPVAIRGAGASRRSTLPATRSRARTTARCVRAPATGRPRRLECGLVLRSVGYRAVPARRPARRARLRAA